ncbi:MAG: sigma-70 family RNA polymerase sigma factor [Microlunatus sp.]|nr:sigma-70 family RNA polymerase sigma factor [Microlunatus sp.]
MIEQSPTDPVDATKPSPPELDPETLLPILRRVIGARMGGHPEAEDLVQEALARVLAAGDRVDPATIEPYAITTARNLVASFWRDGDRFVRNQHRIVDLHSQGAPDEQLLAFEDRTAMATALERFEQSERELLMAHEISGRSVADLAADRDSTAGAVAARLHRLRSRLRVEYLLALNQLEPPSGRCRPVLIALSANDSRRQRELDAEQHLFECDVCRRLRPALGDNTRDQDKLRIPITADADIVAARQAVREIAAQLGMPKVEVTTVATAVSEVVRNIVQFASHGEVVVDLVEDAGRRGLRVTARDVGPGIPDVAAAMQDGFSSSRGLGIGLPGAQRLTDQFTVDSVVGQGTTVTMIKWHSGGTS